MKKYNLPLLLLVMSTSLFTACKKEDKNTDSLLTKTWKRALTDQNASTNPSGQVLYQAVLACEGDDAYHFNADGTFKIDKGTEKCDPNEEKIETGTYSLANKELVIKGIKYTLAEASASQLKYYAVVPAASGYVNLVFLLQ